MNLLKELKPNCYYVIDKSIEDHVTADNYFDAHDYGTYYHGTADLSLIGFGGIEFNYSKFRACPSLFDSRGNCFLFGHTSSPYADMVAEFLNKNGLQTYTTRQDTIGLKHKGIKPILEIPVYNYGCGRYVCVSLDMKDYIKEHYGNLRLLALLKKRAENFKYPFGLKKEFLRILKAKTQIDAAVELLRYETKIIEINKYFSS